MDTPTLALPLIETDGRLRLLLQRADPNTRYTPYKPPLAANSSVVLRRPTAVTWLETAHNVIVEQKQQVLAFSLGFTASVAVVLMAMSAQPARTAMVAPTALQPTIITDSRIAAFASPSLTALVRVARIRVMDEAVEYHAVAATAAPTSEANAANTPTPAFSRVVPAVVAAASAAPVAPRHVLTVPVSPPIKAVARAEAPIVKHHAAPARTHAKPPLPTVKVAKVEPKPPVPRTAKRAAPAPVKSPTPSAPPVVIAAKLPSTLPTPPWSNSWMRSTLGMGNNGP